MFQVTTAAGDFEGTEGPAGGDLAAAIAAVERECFSSPLTEEQIARMLRDANTRWILLWEDGAAESTAGAPRRAAGLAPSAGGELAGYVWLQTVLDEGYIGNVAVRKVSRRRGGGDLLLRALDSFAKEQGLRFLTLEVREHNAPALALYEKHGYRRAGLRPGYYTAPREDAVLMTKDDFPAGRPDGLSAASAEQAGVYQEVS